MIEGAFTDDADFTEAVKRVLNLMTTGELREFDEKLKSAANASRTPPRPTPPLSVLIRDGSIARCNVCHSSMAPWGRNGCIQPECPNFYRG